MFIAHLNEGFVEPVIREGVGYFRNESAVPSSIGKLERNVYCEIALEVRGIKFTGCKLHISSFVLFICSDIVLSECPVVEVY